MRTPILAESGVVIRRPRAHSTSRSSSRDSAVPRPESSPTVGARRIIVDHDDRLTFLGAPLPLALSPIPALADRQVGHRRSLADTRRLPPRRRIANEDLRA